MGQLTHPAITPPKKKTATSLAASLIHSITGSKPPPGPGAAGSTSTSSGRGSPVSTAHEPDWPVPAAARAAAGPLRSASIGSTSSSSVSAITAASQATGCSQPSTQPGEVPLHGSTPLPLAGGALAQCGRNSTHHSSGSGGASTSGRSLTEPTSASTVQQAARGNMQQPQDPASSSGGCGGAPPTSGCLRDCVHAGALAAKAASRDCAARSLELPRPACSAVGGKRSSELSSDCCSTSGSSSLLALPPELLSALSASAARLGQEQGPCPVPSLLHAKHHNVPLKRAHTLANGQLHLFAAFDSPHLAGSHAAAPPAGTLEPSHAAAGQPAGGTPAHGSLAAALPASTPNGDPPARPCSKSGFATFLKRLLPVVPHHHHKDGGGSSGSTSTSNAGSTRASLDVPQASSPTTTSGAGLGGGGGGGSSGWSPVSTPKDGSGPAAATAYKQHHGYLPSPAASFAGGMLQHTKSLKSGAGSLSWSHTSSLAEPDAAAWTALGGTQDTPAMMASRGRSFTKAPWEADRSESGGIALPALAPGGVPLFGAGVGAGATAAGSASSGSAAGGSTGSHLGRLRTYKALDPHLVAALPGPHSVSSISSPASPPHAASPPACSSSSSSGAGAASATASPRCIKLGPASLPGPLQLAVSARLPPGMQRATWCLADFVVQKKLYDGFASSIVKARDRVSGQVVALKLYRVSKLNDISSHQVAREVRLHIGLEHENVIKLHSAFQEAGNVVLVQEFAGGGDLWTFLDSNSGRLTERSAVSLVLQPFLRGLLYLHSVGITHRDIKPENVLFAGSMVLKLADFGLAVNLREERAVTRVGTLDYMAPEVLRCPLKRHPMDNKERVDLHYAAAVDAWAVGVLAYELLTGRAPFSAAGASDATIEVAIQTAAPVFPSRMSDQARAFITAALNRTPSLRPSTLQMLQHSWIRSFQRSSSSGRGSMEAARHESWQHGAPPSPTQQHQPPVPAPPSPPAPASQLPGGALTLPPVNGGGAVNVAAGRAEASIWAGSHTSSQSKGAQGAYGSSWCI